MKKKIPAFDNAGRQSVILLVSIIGILVMIFLGVWQSSNNMPLSVLVIIIGLGLICAILFVYYFLSAYFSTRQKQAENERKELENKQAKRRAFLLSEIKDPNVRLEIKPSLLEELENLNPDDEEQKTMAKHYGTLWKLAESRANSNIHSVTNRQILDEARPYLEKAIRLAPNDSEYRELWKKYYPDHPMPK